MSIEKEAHERLIILEEIKPDEYFSPQKAKEGFYSRELKAALKKRDPERQIEGHTQARSPKSTYTGLLDKILNAEAESDEDSSMMLRAEVMTAFRRNDSQVEAALFKHHMQKQVGRSLRVEPETIDLSRISGMDLLVDGFIPANDLTLLYGKAGSGKTTAALGLAFAVLNGTGFLDHDHPAQPASVLFIASDSGAAPLKAALQDMGAGSHEALTPLARDRLFVWAAEPSQGAKAWSADLHGCIRLQKFVEEHNVKLVLIDSCKAVCSGAGLDYMDNKLVTALLTYFKEVICPYTAVIWINHDGVERGAAAGAKAWKEIPSAVHQITKDDQYGLRTWHAHKMRVGQERRFNYELRDGQLCLMNGEKPIGDCHGLIIAALSLAYQQGRGYLSKSELREQICSAGGPSLKTLDNTLSKGVKAKHPEFTRVDNRIGCYRLAGRRRDALKAQMVGGKEQQQNPVTAMEHASSLPIPTGSQRETREFPREEVGNRADTSADKGSGLIDSRRESTCIATETAQGRKGEGAVGMADHLGNGRYQLRLVD